MLCVGQLAEFTSCVLIWVRQKVKPHNRFIAFSESIKSKGWFSEKRSFVLCVGQLGEFTRCVLIWVGQKVKPHYPDGSNAEKEFPPKKG